MNNLSTPGDDASYPCRVFISYSHSDRQTVERLVGLISKPGISPMWDADLLPGSGFSEQIQSYIRNSHVFLPVLTPASAERPWLHQEIGFAIALGKPVLPVALGCLPVGIISGVQAVQLHDDISDAPMKLSAEVFSRLMDRIPEHSESYESTDDNVRRAFLLARYAESVWAIRHHGRVRQAASLTTFHLPDRPATDPIWKRYFAGTPDDEFLFGTLRQERVALQRHARADGCQLILDPADRLKHVYRRHGPGAVRARVNGLLSFLRDDSVTDVVVAINNDMERKESITLVGDWFFSKAVSSGEQRVLTESLFTRSATMVRQQIQDFDQRMRDLLALREWTEHSSRADAMSYLQAYLDSTSE
jgi:hypothetical protein